MEGDLIDTTIPAAALDSYAARLLPMGPAVRVEAPPGLIARLRQR